MMHGDYRFGDFTLTASTRELKRGDTPVAISPRAFDCLAYLIEHRDRAVGKDELVAAIWERVDVSDTQLGQTVLRARRAVNDDGQAQNVITHGVALRLSLGRRCRDRRATIDLARDRVARIPSRTPTRDERCHSASAAPTTNDARHRSRRIDRSAGSRLRSRFGRDRDRRGHPVDIARAARRTRRSLATAPYGSAVVLPLRVASPTSDAWLRLGAMDLVAERLRAGGLAVPPSENTVALLQNLPDGSDADRRDPPRRAERADRQRRHRARRHHVARRIARRRRRRHDADRRIVRQPMRSPRRAMQPLRLLGRLGRARPPDPPYATRRRRAARARAGRDAGQRSGRVRARSSISDPDLAHAEPELGYRLAMVDFRAGEYARAEASLTSLLVRARRERSGQHRFRARVLDGRGAVRIRQDNYAGAEKRLRRRAGACCRIATTPPKLGRALTGRGVSRSMRRDFAPALADLGQARVQLEEAGDTLAIARVDTDQAALEMNRDRPQAALGYLESAAAVFERYGAINELMETLESIVSNHIVLLQPADSARRERSQLGARRARDRSEPAPQSRRGSRRGVPALGRLRDAGALLSTLPDDAPDANAFVARRLHALRARLALAQGDNANAAAEAKRALALPAPSDDLGEGVAEIALVYQRAMLAAVESRHAAPAAAWIDFDKARLSGAGARRRRMGASRAAMRRRSRLRARARDGRGARPAVPMSAPSRPRSDRG